MKRPRAALLIAGLVVFAAGFAYAAIFAGVPYQDPTPDMQARWSLKMRIGDAIAAVGAAMIALALLAAALAAVSSRFRPRKPPQV